MKWYEMKYFLFKSHLPHQFKSLANDGFKPFARFLFFVKIPICTLFVHYYKKRGSENNSEPYFYACFEDEKSRASATASVAFALASSKA